MKVGLVWAGNPEFKADRLRSPGLAAVRPLLDTAGVSFFGLQKGAGRRDLDTAGPLPDSFVDLGPEIGDFADTAAIMANLDLIITSCTGPAHLAGGLGRAHLDIAALFPRLALAGGGGGYVLVSIHAAVPAGKARGMGARGPACGKRADRAGQVQAWNGLTPPVLMSGSTHRCARAFRRAASWLKPLAALMPTMSAWVSTWKSCRNSSPRPGRSRILQRHRPERAEGGTDSRDIVAGQKEDGLVECRPQGAEPVDIGLRLGDRIAILKKVAPPYMDGDNGTPHGAQRRHRWVDPGLPLRARLQPGPYPVTELHWIFIGEQGGTAHRGPTRAPRPTCP